MSRFCKKAVLHVCLRSLNCTCKGVHFLLKLQTRGRSNPPMAFLFTTLFSKCLVDNCFRRLRAFFQVKKHFCFFSSKKHFSDHQCRAASLRRFSKKLAYIFSNGLPRLSWKLTRTVQGTGLKRHFN